jgi:hypothetical protein
LSVLITLRTVPNLLYSIGEFFHRKKEAKRKEFLSFFLHNVTVVQWFPLHKVYHITLGMLASICFVCLFWQAGRKQAGKQAGITPKKDP